MDKFSAALGHGTGRHFENLFSGHFTLRRFIDTISPYRDRMLFWLYDGHRHITINGHEVRSAHLILVDFPPSMTAKPSNAIGPQLEESCIGTVQGVWQMLDGGRYHDYNLDSTMYFMDHRSRNKLFYPLVGIELMYKYEGSNRSDVGVQVHVDHPVIEITDRKAHA